MSIPNPMARFRSHTTAPAQRHAQHVAVGSPIKPPTVLGQSKPRTSGAVGYDKSSAPSHSHAISQHHYEGGMRTVRHPNIARGLPK